MAALAVQRYRVQCGEDHSKSEPPNGKDPPPASPLRGLDQANSTENYGQVPEAREEVAHDT